MVATAPSQTMRIVQQHELGGPEVLKIAEAPIPRPAEDQVLIRVSYCGVNFADILGRRTGNNHLATAQLPIIPGAEVVGRREDTGERVVAICGTGGYAQYAIAPRARTFAVPAGIDDGQALALLVQGLTAWYLYQCTAVKPAETVLIHAAGGGVGSLAVQLGKLLGVRRIIATASTESKRELARTLGADVALDSSGPGLPDRVRVANSGHPIDVVFERSGGALFEESLALLAPFGRVLVYGSSSGEENTLSTRRLIAGSRTVSGLWLMDALRDAQQTTEALRRLFDWCRRGALKPVLGTVYPLTQAAQAQIDMAERRTTGKVLLDANK